jgi:hypothetical protein
MSRPWGGTGAIYDLTPVPFSSSVDRIGDFSGWNPWAVSSRKGS